MSDALDKILASTGLAIYAATGLACIVCGGMFLQYNAVPLLPDPADVSKYLIDLVEIGIGITVLAVMISLFFDVSPPEPEPAEAEE